ncbi:L-2-hydroxyglutarate oxidase [Photobacterium aphoticum]|uniref:L-2-hydroxyglutarate oxidase n=1 Tax=Photobacterium aphoticum TaxID=754436 RepID=A0A090QN14_9GAMM|nr:L-2-hydroxyglutarate oxidase [Photobacterium aphoticum]
MGKEAISDVHKSDAHKSDDHTRYDYIVIGGGIVGVSTAWQLQQRYPDKSVLLLEKEAALSCHQTGHNSGVIHAGVYYAPGSLKATFCKAGVEATKAFCAEHDIAVENCGKLLVATDDAEYTVCWHCTTAVWTMALMCNC